MTTLEKLEEALNHMQEANSLINDAKKENSSLFIQKITGNSFQKQ